MVLVRSRSVPVRLSVFPLLSEMANASAVTEPPLIWITGPAVFSKVLPSVRLASGPARLRVESWRSRSELAEAMVLSFKLIKGLVLVMVALRLPPVSTKTRGPVLVLSVELVESRSGPARLILSVDCTKTKFPPTVTVVGAMVNNGSVVLLVRDPPTSKVLAPIVRVAFVASRRDELVIALSPEANSIRLPG